MSGYEQSGAAAENQPTPEVSPQRAFFERLFEEARGDMTAMVTSIDAQPEAVAFAQALGEILIAGRAESMRINRLFGDKPPIKDAPHKEVAQTVRGIIADAYEHDDITRVTKEKMWNPVFKHIDNMAENGWMVPVIIDSYNFLQANQSQFIDDGTVE